MKVSTGTKTTILFAALLMVFATPSWLRAQSGTWTQTTSGGLWSNSGNWLGGIVADGSGATADFSQIDITADNNVHMDASHTLTAIIFGNKDASPAANWVLDDNGTGGGNILTLAGSSPSIAVNNLGAGETATISAAMAGGAAWAKSGPGNLILSGNSTLSSNINISSGQLTLANAANLNGGTIRTFTIGSGTTLSIAYGGTVSGTTFANSFGSGITVVGNGTLQFDPGSGLGLGLVNVSGGATFYLGMTGGLININSGILNNGGFTSQNWTTNKAGMNIASGAIFDVWNGAVVYIDALTGAGTLRDTETSGDTLNIGVNNGSGEFDGPIGGLAAIVMVKTGKGTEIFTGVDTNPGPVSVNGGALLINGNFTAYANTNGYSVNAGGTLGGTGVIGHPTYINNGGTLGAGLGTAIATLTFSNNLTLNAGSTNFMGITKTGGSTTNDVIVGLGALNFAGTLVVTNITSDASTLAAGDTFQLFNTAGGSGGFNNFVLPVLPVGLSWDTSQLAASGFIRVYDNTTVAMPVLSPGAGQYVGAQVVTLTCITPGATIYYTTNGTTPTTSSLSGPSGLTITLPSNTLGETIEAFGHETGFADSALVIAAYQTVPTAFWTNPAGGSWATPGNWLNNVIGTGAYGTADFSTLTLSSLTDVTLDGTWTIANLKFGDVGNTYGWEIDPGSGGPFTLSGINSTITVSNQTVNFTAVIAGTNNLTTAGNGTLIFNGDNTFAGNINVTAGELNLANAANLDSGVSRIFSIATNSMLSISYGSPTEGNATSAGFGAGITVVGNGTLQFDPGSGNYIGLVSLSSTPYLNLNMSNGWINVISGTLVDGGWQSQNWTNSKAGLNIASGAQLDVWNGNWLYIDALTGSGSIINGYPSGVGNTLNIGVNNGSGEFDGSISSVPPINFVKSGAGTQIFTGSDSAPGSITVNGGAMLINGDFSLVTGSFTANAGGTLGGSGLIGGAVTINSGGTLGVKLGTGVGTLTLANLLTFSPGSTNFMSITKTGGPAACDLITGYTAGTTFHGTLVVTNITSDSSTLAVGDTFQLFNGSGALGAFDHLVLPNLPVGLSWDASQLATTGYLTVANTAAVPIFNPPAGGYVGAQTVTITCLTPGATIYYTTNGSVPTTSSPSGLSGLTVAVPANTTGLTIQAFASKTGFAASAVVSAVFQTIAIPTWTNPNGGSWATAGNWSNNVVGNGANVAADFSTLTLPSQPYVTMDAPWIIGSLKFGDVGNTYGWEIDSGSGGPLTLAGTNTTITVSNQAATITAVIVGTNNLTTAGPGTLILSGNNTFTGNINVTSGQLTLANSANLNSQISRTFNIPSGATLSIGYGGTVSGTTFSKSFGSGITVTGNGTLQFDPGSGLGLGLVNISGGAKLNFGMTGGVININSGIVINGGNTSQNWTTNLAALNIAAGATFDNWNGSAVYVDALTGSGTLSDGYTSGTSFNFGVNNGSGTFSGNISSNNTGTVTLNKLGTGTEIFTGTDSNPGTISVNNGALFINGSTTTTGLVSVASGAILGGVGTIGGRVNATAGGFLAPGASPFSLGTLTLSFNATNTLTLNGNTLFFGLSTVANSDKIAIAGNLVLNGANIVQLSAPSGSIPAGTYTLMTYPSKTGSGTLALQAAYPNATLTVGATSVTLNVTATTYVPGAVWQGAVSGVWDGGALNWTRNGTGSSAYVAGDSVTFDDTATGNFTVSSGSLVLPGSVTFNNSFNNYTVSAGIGGAGPLVKNGSGTLTLSGANTYTNTTTLNSGMLRFAGGSALPGASAINLGPGTLQILNDGAGNGGTIALGNSITLSGALTTDTINVGNNGSGHTGNIVAFGSLNNGTPANANVSTINFTAANGYLMSFGVLGLPGSGGNTTTLNPTTTSLIITNVVNQETSFSGHYDTVTLGGTSIGNVINGVISDSSGYTSVGNGDTRVTMSGNGWTLSGTNTYHGPTSVTTGNLTIGGAGELGAGNYTGTISISSGAALNYASSASQIFSGVISGAGNLTNAGFGTLILSATNTLTGLLQVPTGELVGVAGGACSNAAVLVASGATNGVQVPVFGGQWACSNLTYGAGTTYLDINFGSAYPNTTNAPLFVNGNLTNNGTVNLIVRSSVGIGVGVYPLVKYTGVTNGPLPATAFALPAGMVGSLSNDVVRKSLDLVVTTAGTGPIPLEWAVGNGTWDLNTTANWKDFNNVTGQYYTGGNAVTFDDSASGASPITVTLNSTVNPANVTVNATKNYTISGTGGIAGSAALTKNGTGTNILSGVNTYTGTTTVNTGTLQFAGGNALPGASPISLGAATLQILNDGAGSGGTISLGNSITLNVAATTDTINVGNNGSGHTGNTVAFGALNNGAPGNAFVSTINFTAANGYLMSFGVLGLPGLSGNTTTLNPTTTSLIITNVVNQETLFIGHYDTVTLGGTSTGNVINGVISDSSGYTSVGNGDTRVTMTGIGWTLSGTNTYHGPTAISTNTLTIGGAGQLGAGNYTGTISIGTNSALNYASSASQILAGVISGAGNLTNAGGALTLTATNTYTGTTAIGAGSTLAIGGAGMLNNGIYAGLIINNGAFNYASSANQTNSGVISGTGSLTNAGPGILTLTGANTYTGNTTVNGGTLVLTSPTLATNSTVTVANNAVLKLNFAVTNQVATLVLNGAPQPPGVYNSGNTPLIAGTGSLMIASSGPMGFTNPTAITGFSLNGANVVISGTNGQAGVAYYLLASTNLTLRLNQWTVVATNVPASSGNYSFTATNAVFSGALQQFYILSNTNF